MRQKPVCVSLAFNYHDSSVSVSCGEEIQCVVEAERILRRKKWACTPRQMDMLIGEVLNVCGLDAEDVDRWLVGSLNNPYGVAAPLEKTAEVSLPILGENRRCTVFNHHYAHAGSFLFSSFRKALVSSCDGGGDDGQRVAFYQGEGLGIEPLRIDPQECTSTKPYGQCAAFLFQAPFCEGRVMALAAYEEPVKKYTEILKEAFSELRNCKYTEGQQWLQDRVPELRGLACTAPIRAAGFCASLQSLFQERRCRDVGSELLRSGNESVVIAGGSGLNLSVNTMIHETITRNIFILPCCDDTGIALCQNGIAIAEMCGERPQVALPFCGIHDGRRWKDYAKKPTGVDITDDVECMARAISNGRVVLLHNGRPEIGPRALGHRSFLMSACCEKNRDILGVQIKGRERFRPLAPITLGEDVGEYFDGPPKSPFMLFSYKAKPKARELLPAAIHVDGSSRVQTVAASEDPLMHELLRVIKDMTGIGTVLNTSLNLRGEPIANDVHDTMSISRRVHYDHCIGLVPSW